MASTQSKKDLRLPSAGGSYKRAKGGKLQQVQKPTADRADQPESASQPAAEKKE